MHSHALLLRELQRQELLAEAASERKLDQLGPAVPIEKAGVFQRRAALRQYVVTALASFRPARHLRTQATAN